MTGKSAKVLPDAIRRAISVSIIGSSWYSTVTNPPLGFAMETGDSVLKLFRVGSINEITRMC